MATINQVQRGFTTFVDTEIACALSGWQKAVVAGCAGMIAANFTKLAELYKNHPLNTALGIIDPNTGEIDIDSIYNAIVPRLAGDKIPITIPKIGTIKMGQEEFNSLMRHIREANR
jgi:hypothetical protein